MSADRARSGELLAVDPGASVGASAGGVALVRDDRLEVMRWVLPAGREVPEHLAYGPATVHCVRGEATLSLGSGTATRMPAGAVVYLAAGERHALRAHVDTVLLVTMVLAPPRAGTSGSAPGGGPPPLHGARTDGGSAGK